MEQRFAGQVVVVTGGAGGLGAAIVDRFLSEGARVALVDRDATSVDAAAAARDCLGLTADVSA